MENTFLRLARFSLALVFFIPLAIFTLVPVFLTAFRLATTLFLSFVKVLLDELQNRILQPVRVVARMVSSNQRTRTAASARKRARKNRGVRPFATTKLPGNNMTFKVPGHQTYSGREIRRAVYASHLEHAANTQRTQSEIRCSSPLKPFHNYNHRIPHSPSDVKPLNHMQGSGHEFPIGPHNNRQKGPARIIVQFTNGHTELQGVVARDLSRPLDSPGSSDDFEVTPGLVEPFWDLGETFINERSTSRRANLLKAFFVR